MYEYLKNHSYISYNKKSTYEFELSEERAECIANKYDSLTGELQQENKILKDKLSKIETLIMNHNSDTGDIYYKYNNRFLKSELKQRILEIVYEEKIDYLQSLKGNDSNGNN